MLIRLLHISIILSQVNGYPVCIESKRIRLNRFACIGRGCHPCKINRTKIVSFHFLGTIEWNTNEQSFHSTRSGIFIKSLSFSFSANLDEGDMLFPDEPVLTGVSEAILHYIHLENQSNEP